MPPKRPNTAVAEVRCDRRVLASFAVYYSEKEEKPKSTSDLLRFIIYDFYDILLKHKLIKEILSTAESLEILTELKFENLNRSNRGLVTLSKQISKESILSIDSEIAQFEAKLKELENNESTDS